MATVIGREILATEPDAPATDPVADQKRIQTDGAKHWRECRRCRKADWDFNRLCGYGKQLARCAAAYTGARLPS